MFYKMEARLVTRGMYAPMLAWWLEYFHPDSFLILNMQEVKHDVISVANRVAKFAGVDVQYAESMLIDESTGEEKKFVPRQHNGWKEPTERVW